MSSLIGHVTIYKANRFYSLPILAFLLLLSIVTFASVAPPKPNEIQGLIGFWIIGLVLTIVPFGGKLAVSDSYVKAFFFGIPIRKIEASRVQVVVYGDLFRGGLGLGKGLKGWELIHPERQLFRSKYFSIGERLHGKEAIAHAKRVLESQLPRRHE